MKPLLLDLYCGAGGSALGYADAGFDVVGIDIDPQPFYPFPFIQGDAFSLPIDLKAVDAIHASPPCQAHTTMSNRKRHDKWLNLIPQTRDILRASAKPYVIENVPGAASWMESPMVLSGPQLGLDVFRPRLFESNVPLVPPGVVPRSPSLEQGSSEMTLGTVFILWERAERHKWSPATIQKHRRIINRFKPLAEMKVDQANPETVDALYDSFMDEGLSISTLRRINSAARSAVNWARRAGHVQVNPFSVIRSASNSVGIYGEPNGRWLWKREDGSVYRAWRWEDRSLIGMEHVSDPKRWHDVVEAVPPGYTRYIGLQLMGVV